MVNKDDQERLERYAPNWCDSCAVFHGHEHCPLCEAGERLRESEATLARLREWATAYGAELCPRGNPDTFGEGMREAKRQIKHLIGASK